MGKISNTVQQHVERFWQKQMKLDKFTQPGCRDAANNHCERDKMYGTAELRVPAVFKRQMDYVTAVPALTTFAEKMEPLEIVPGISQIPQETSQWGCCQMKLWSGNPQSYKWKASLMPGGVPDSSPIHKAMHVDRIRFHPGILFPLLITI